MNKKFMRDWFRVMGVWLLMTLCVAIIILGFAYTIPMADKGNWIPFVGMTIFFVLILFGFVSWHFVDSGGGKYHFPPPPAPPKR